MAVAEHKWTLTEETTGKAFRTILTKLEQNFADPEYTRMLQRSPYERSKASANVEYARTLLLKMEHAQPSTTTRNTKQPPQSTSQQRQSLKKCEDQLYDITQASAINTQQPAGSADPDDDSDDDDEDMQDILRRFAPAKPTSSGLDTEPPDPPNTQDTTNTTSDAQTNAAAATITSTLRSRRAGAQDPTNSSSTATATTTSSALPFPPASFSSASTATTTLLDNHTLTQDTLTTSLLTLARALNTSTNAFSVSLAESNPLVDAATKALDKNVTGMESAERRMGMLRRMTEGRGWWGRLTLWGWVGVGWVILLVVMFVMPKLRM